MNAGLHAIGLDSLDALEDFVVSYGPGRVVPQDEHHVVDTQLRIGEESESMRAKRYEERKLELVDLKEQLSRAQADTELQRGLAKRAALLAEDRERSIKQLRVELESVTRDRDQLAVENVQLVAKQEAAALPPLLPPSASSPVMIQQLTQAQHQELEFGMLDEIATLTVRGDALKRALHVAHANADIAQAEHDELRRDYDAQAVAKREAESLLYAHQMTVLSLPGKIAEATAAEPSHPIASDEHPIQP